MRGGDKKTRALAQVLRSNTSRGRCRLLHRSRSSAFVCSPPGRCLCWERKLRWSTLRNRCRPQSPRRWGRSGAPANRNHGFVGRTAAGSTAASQTGMTRPHVIERAPRRFEHLKRWYLHDGDLALDVVDRLQPARAGSFGAAVDTARFALKRNVMTVLRGCTRPGVVLSILKRLLLHAPQKLRSC